MPKKQNKATSQKRKPLSEKERLNLIFNSNNQGVKIDLGCGETKQPGWVGVDFREMPGVDIVQDLTKFPWTKLPDECANMVMTSHLLEHINPASNNPQLAGLIKLLLAKKKISQAEVDAFIGEYEFLGGFIRFMDECWRILKPGGVAIHTFPYAGSHGYWQDPTHINPINETTLTYFDPLAKDEKSGQYYGLYNIYRPQPWKIEKYYFNTVGFVEVQLSKRAIDKSYKVSSAHGLKA